MEYLDEKFPGLDCRYTERAAGSEDAFDAAVSALVMDKHRDKLCHLPEGTDETELLEGLIWNPIGNGK